MGDSQVEVIAAAKSGNVWYRVELPPATVTAFVTVLRSKPEITEIRVEVTR